jgi:hypothetical protein
MAVIGARRWRQAFIWAAVWVTAATVATFAYVFEWLGRPFPYELWAILGFLLFAGNITLPLTAAMIHRSWRVGLAVAVVGVAVLAVVFVIGLIRFAGAAGGFR